MAVDVNVIEILIKSIFAIFISYKCIDAGYNTAVILTFFGEKFAI
jgi:hypothetical protein